MDNRIHLMGEFRREELLAAASITPGHLVEETSDDKFQVHATEGGRAERIVAAEDALQGKPKTTVYLVGVRVSANVELPGNESQMFLKAGENVSQGDYLISAGDGTLIADGSEDSLTTVKQAIATAREAVDLSGSGAVNTLMRVRLM